MARVLAETLEWPKSIEGQEDQRTAGATYGCGAVLFALRGIVGCMEREITRFAAPWGRATRVISLAVGVGIIGLTVVAVTVVPLPSLARMALITAPVLIVAATTPFMVLGYEIRDEFLVVKRPGWTTRIPLAGLRAVALDPKLVGRSIRIFGNGGLFAFNGLFWNKHLGRYRAYVTDLKRSVVLTLNDRTVVISPDAPERFFESLRAQRLLPA
jgi:hypothetical protein